MPRKKKASKEDLPSSSEILEIADLYIIINYVQTQQKQCTFTVMEQDSYIVENILKDTNIIYEKSIQGKEKVYTYSVKPPPDSKDDDYKFSFDEFLYKDEIQEDGQCF